MKPSYKEVLEQLHEQGIIIDVLERRIHNYKQQIEVLKKNSNFDKKKIWQLK